jgi:GNAT superfamily N-acetyltransferase
MTAHTARVGDEIVFRQTDSPIASSGYPGELWSVEYRRPGVALPVAEAWVHASPHGAYLGLLFVVEGYRRQGIGTALFGAIRQRWPNVEYDAVTEAGEEFVKGMSD